MEFSFSSFQMKFNIFFFFLRTGFSRCYLFLREEGSMMMMVV